MSQQTDYEITMSKAFAGLLGDIAPREVSGKIWESLVATKFGKWVTRGTSDNQAQAPSTVNDDMIGVVIASQGARTLGLGETEITIPQKDTLNVLRKGNIYVATEDACVPGDQVFVRYAGKSQVQTIVFDAALITANVINGDVGAVSIAPVTYATSNAATLTAIAAAITTANSNILSAVSDGTDTITVTTVADVADQDIASWVVTLGASQAGVTEAETVVAINTSEIGNSRTDVDSTTAVAVDWEFEETGAIGDVVKIRKR